MRENKSYFDNYVERFKPHKKNAYKSRGLYDRESNFDRLDEMSARHKLDDKEKLGEDFLNNYSSKHRLLEKRVVADLDEFDRQKKLRPDFADFVTTKGEDLPENYRHLLGEAFPKYKNKTLEDLIVQSVAELGNNDVYFSLDGNGNITGFIAVVVSEDDNVVTNLKMCSLEKGNTNRDIGADLTELLSELIGKYKSVSWYATCSNRANTAYKLFVRHHKGSFTEIPEGNRIYYTVPGETGGH